MQELIFSAVQPPYRAHSSKKKVGGGGNRIIDSFFFHEISVSRDQPHKL